MQTKHVAGVVDVLAELIDAPSAGVELPGSPAMMSTDMNGPVDGFR